MQTSYTPLGGGLDYRSSALSVQPGRLVDCVNFEQAYGVQGYRRCYGYERNDGHPEPHLAEYFTQPFQNGSTAFLAGDTVTGPGGTSGKVLQVILTSGTWMGGTAAGTLVLGNVVGSWAQGANIQVSAVTYAVAAAATEQANITEPEHYNFLRLARESRRSVIAKVPGAGPVLGVAVYMGAAYAVRNITGGATSTLWRTSAAGWIAVKTGLPPNAKHRFTVANFTGDPRTVALFGVNGVSPPFKWNGTTFTSAGAIYGSEASSTTSNSITTGSKTFSIAESSRGWQVGDVLTVRNSAYTGSMTGAVTAYAHPSVTINVTSVTGSGTFAAWTISDAAGTDRAFDLIAHKDHMFYAYPLGQLQTSNLGDPLVATSTASLFALGDEITGLVSLKGDTLAVFCRDRFALLAGSNATDWQLKTYTQGSTGAVKWTAVESGGNSIFLDKSGVMSLQATQAYGDFEPSDFSQDVSRLLLQLLPSVVGARITRESYQYRLYTSTGFVLNFALMTPNPVITPKDVAPTVQEYAHQPTCFANGDIGGQDAMFFGTADGYLMRESVGTSFDGASISAVMRLPFNHFKSPTNNKRFHKILMELEARDSVELRFLQLFDYDDGFFVQSVNQSALAESAGGQWDVSLWDTFLFSMPMVSQAEANVAGVGRNMGMVLWNDSDVAEPFILQGIMTQYTTRGARR